MNTTRIMEGIAGIVGKARVLPGGAVINSATVQGKAVVVTVRDSSGTIQNVRLVVDVEADGLTRAEQLAGVGQKTDAEVVLAAMVRGGLALKAIKGTVLHMPAIKRGEAATMCGQVVSLGEHDWRLEEGEVNCKRCLEADGRGDEHATDAADKVIDWEAM